MTGDDTTRGLAHELALLEERVARARRRRALATRAVVIAGVLLGVPLLTGLASGPLAMVMAILLIPLVLVIKMWYYLKPARRLERFAEGHAFKLLAGAPRYEEGDQLGPMTVTHMSAEEVAAARWPGISAMRRLRMLDAALVGVGVLAAVTVWTIVLLGIMPLGSVLKGALNISAIAIAGVVWIAWGETVSWRIEHGRMVITRLRLRVKERAPLEVSDPYDLALYHDESSLMIDKSLGGMRIHPLAPGDIARWQVRRLRASVRAQLTPELDEMWDALARAPHAPGIVGAWAQRLGAGPRFVGTLREPEWPGWVTGSPTASMQEAHAEHHFLVQHGLVVPGALAMANTDLFEPGTDSYPAVMVWSPDPEVAHHPELLHTFAERAFYCKTREGIEDERLARVHEVMDDSYGPMGFRLPDILTDGRVAYLSGVMIFREWLASGVADADDWALLVHRDSRAAVVLPTEVI